MQEVEERAAPKGRVPGPACCGSEDAQGGEVGTAPLGHHQLSQRLTTSESAHLRGWKRGDMKERGIKRKQTNFISTAALRSSIYCPHLSLSLEETKPCSWWSIFSLSLLRPENIYRSINGREKFCWTANEEAKKSVLPTVVIQLNDESKTMRTGCSPVFGFFFMVVKGFFSAFFVIAVVLTSLAGAGM